MFRLQAFTRTAGGFRRRIAGALCVLACMITACASAENLSSIDTKTLESKRPRTEAMARELLTRKGVGVRNLLDCVQIVAKAEDKPMGTYLLERVKKPIKERTEAYDDLVAILPNLGKEKL